MGVSDKTVLVLVIISLIARIFFLFGDTVSWDSAVYLEMGKYMLSAGEAGLWEASRPLLWPLMLGFLWKLKLDPIFFGRILATVFSLGCIYVTYLIGKGLFNRKVGLVSAALLSFSPTFFNNNSILLTEIPSTFFSLLAVYLFIKDKSALSGFFFGMSFLTKFLQALILGSLLFLLYLRKHYFHTLKKLFIVFIFFILTIAPYLLINNILYRDALFPFSLQLFLTQNTGWLWFEPFTYYFANVLKENFISILALAGIFLVFTKSKYENIIIAIIVPVVFIILSLLEHKEMRFLIPALPYLYILGAYGLFYISNQLKRNRVVAISFILIVFASLAFQIPTSLKEQAFYNDLEFQDYLQNIDGNIWVSSPIYLVKTDKRASELVYYPIFNEKRAKELSTKLNEADVILLNTCDILCNPGDSGCPAAKGEFIEKLKQNFKTDYYRKIERCEKYIFTSS